MQDVEQNIICSKHIWCGYRESQAYRTHVARRCSNNYAERYFYEKEHLTLRNQIDFSAKQTNVLFIRVSERSPSVAELVQIG